MQFFLTIFFTQLVKFIYFVFFYKNCQYLRKKLIKLEAIVYSKKKYSNL